MQHVGRHTLFPASRLCTLHFTLCVLPEVPLLTGRAPHGMHMRLLTMRSMRSEAMLLLRGASLALLRYHSHAMATFTAV